jgi:23S rRNA (adenine2503-C2)-methyltransferase
MPIHVNLIPVNPVEESGYRTPARERIARFAAALEKFGVRATVRRTLGPDIQASCGQLRRAAAKDGQA